MFLTSIRSADVRRLLARSRELELSVGAVQRLKWLLFALENNNNVSLTCRHFGIARTTFVRWAERFDARNPASLEEHSRCPHTVRTSELDPAIVALIRDLRMKHTEMGKVQIQKILQDHHGIALSSSTIGRTIARHNMFYGNSPSHLRKRGEDALQLEAAQRVQEVRINKEHSPSDSDEGFLPLPPDSKLAY